MAPHFGSKVTGDAEFDRAVREEKGGAHVFGTRVRNAIPEDGPTNAAKRQSEFGVAVVDGAHGSDTEGKPAESLEVEKLKSVLAENPTFFDSLYEAELARNDGARPEALGIFYEIERGIKGAMRPDVMKEIRALLGQKGIDADALADRAAAHREVLAGMAERNEENKLLADAGRVKALRQHAEDVEAVKESRGADQNTLIATDVEGQIQQIATRDGLNLSGTTATGTGPEPTKPEGDTRVETQSPGSAPFVPKGDTTTGEQGSGAVGTSPATGAGTDQETMKTSETAKDVPDFDVATKAVLEAYLGDEAANVTGSGAEGRVTRDDLVKAAKKKARADAKASSAKE